MDFILWPFKTSTVGNLPCRDEIKITSPYSLSHQHLQWHNLLVRYLKPNYPVWSLSGFQVTGPLLGHYNFFLILVSSGLYQQPPPLLTPPTQRQIKERENTGIFGSIRKMYQEHPNLFFDVFNHFMYLSSHTGRGMYWSFLWGWAG